MSTRPPIPASSPSRRCSSGRGHGVAVILLVALVMGCATTSPSLHSTGSPSASSGSAPPGSLAVSLPGLSGLLVAAGSPLQVTTRSGDLEPFDDRPDPAMAVTAGGGGIVVGDAQFLAWHALDPGPAARTWRRVTLPTDGGGQRPLFALAPDGQTLAVATGELQGRRFDLVLVDLVLSTSRSIQVDSGLNGQPVWVVPASIAFNVIRADQRSGFVAVDVASGARTDMPTFGFALSASADGSIVALDDSATGDARVGARIGLLADGLDGLFRIRAAAGFATTDVALNGDGTRLAIVSRSDGATSLELLGLANGVWNSGQVLTFDADPVLSIAWLR